MDAHQSGSHESGNASAYGRLSVENQQLKSDLASAKRKMTEMTVLNDELMWIKLQFAGLNFKISTLKDENQQLKKRIPIYPAAKRRCIDVDGVPTRRNPHFEFSHMNGCNSTMLLSPTVEGREKGFSNIIGDAIWEEIAVESSIGIKIELSGASVGKCHDNGELNEVIVRNDCQDAVDDTANPIDMLNASESTKEVKDTSQIDIQIASLDVAPTKDGHANKMEAQKSFDKAHFENHKTSSCSRRFECEICSKPIAKNSDLTSHLRIQTGETPFECKYPGCDKKCKQSGHLQSHRRAHTGEQPFQCNYPGCDQRFSRNGNLLRHKRVHTGESPFQCNYPGCQKRFITRGNLNSHKRIHSEESPRNY